MMIFQIPGWGDIELQSTLDLIIRSLQSGCIIWLLLRTISLQRLVRLQSEQIAKMHFITDKIMEAFTVHIDELHFPEEHEPPDPNPFVKINEGF